MNIINYIASGFIIVSLISATALFFLIPVISLVSRQISGNKYDKNIKKVSIALCCFYILTMLFALFYEIFGQRNSIRLSDILLVNAVHWSLPLYFLNIKKPAQTWILIFPLLMYFSPSLKNMINSISNNPEFLGLLYSIFSLFIFGVLALLPIKMNLERRSKLS